MTRRIALAGLILGIAMAFGQCLALGQGKDSLVGGWQLERGKSDFNPDTTLQSRSVEFTAKDGGISFVQKTVTAAGNTVQSDYVAKYDGKDVLISGSQLDTVALKRIDANTVERSGKIKGQVVETATMKVSPDGKTLTIITKGTIDGEEYGSTQVYSKQ